MNSREHLNLRLWFLVLMLWGVTSCSSSPSNQAVSSISSSKPINDSPSLESGNTPTESQSEYTPLDRAIIYNYAEKGGDDVGIVNKAMEMVRRAEQRSEEERVVEDYLLLAIHYWCKDDAKKTTQYVSQGISIDTDNKRMKAYLLIYLGYANENKDRFLAKSNFEQAIQADPDFYKGHYEVGRIHFRNWKFTEAEAKFKQALSLKPDNASTHEWLGHVYWKAEKHEEAFAAFSKALQLDPEDSVTLRSLGDVLFYGLNKSKEAGRFYKEAVFHNSNDPSAHNALGNYYQYWREYQKAEEEFKEAIRLSPTHPHYGSELKELYTEIKEMPKAEKELKDSLAKKPDSPEVRMQLGKFYLKWKKLDDAESQFKMAVKLAPKNPEYIGQLGRFYDRVGDYDKAEFYLNSALKIDPGLLSVRLLLGRVYQEQKKYDQAISQFSQAVKQDPNSQEAVGRLKTLQEIINPPTKEDREKELIEKVRLNPNDHEPLILLAGFYYQKHNYEKAVETYQKVFLINPESIFTRYLLGETYLVQKKIDEAEKEYLIALKIISKVESPPREKYEHWNITIDKILGKLTVIYVEQKNYQKAEKLYHNAYKSIPDSIFKHYNLAYLYKLQEKTDEWKLELEAIIQLEPKEIGSRIQLARYYVEQEDYIKAESLYREILKIKPSNTAVQAELDAIEPFLEKPEQTYAGMPKKIAEKLKIPVGEGWSSLHFAAAKGDAKEVEKLLSQGADIEEKNEHGRTPLYVAAKRGRLEVIKLLLKKGADVNARARVGGYSPLHVAAGYKHSQVVEYLIAHGAKVDARTHWRDTVLMSIMYDVWHRDSSIAEILVRHGADIRATNKFGCQAICYASQEGNPYAVEFLLKQGINPNWKNAHGATPLYLAVSSNHSKAVQALLEGGADPRVDVDGITPLDLARSLNHKPIVAILQNWDPQSKTKKVARP